MSPQSLTLQGRRLFSIELGPMPAPPCLQAKADQAGATFTLLADYLPHHESEPTLHRCLYVLASWPAQRRGDAPQDVTCKHPACWQAAAAHADELGAPQKLEREQIAWLTDFAHPHRFYTYERQRDPLPLAALLQLLGIGATNGT